MYSNIRKNARVGLIEQDDFSISASEWWNGEGLDFSIDAKGDLPKTISLHIEALESLIILVTAMGFIDLDYIKDESDVVIEETKKHDELLKNLCK